MAGEATDRPDAVPTDAVPTGSAPTGARAGGRRAGDRRGRRRGGRRRSRLLDVVRWGLLVLILGAVGVTLWRNWEAVSGELGRLGWSVVLGAFVLVAAAPVLTLMGWRVLLADLGTHPPPPRVQRLPRRAAGEVPAGLGVDRRRADRDGGPPARPAAADGRRRHPVDRPRRAHGRLLGIPAVPRLVDRESQAFSWWWVVLAVVLGGVLLWPRLLNAVIAKGLSLLGREPLEHELSGRAIALTSVWFVAAWVSTGLGTFLLARSVAPDAPLGPLLVTSIGGFALASAGGMFSFLVPAGVGVRDGILALLLVTLMPLPAATAVVVVARFLAVLADLLLAGSAWAWAAATTS